MKLQSGLLSLALGLGEWWGEAVGCLATKQKLTRRDDDQIIDPVRLLNSSSLSTSNSSLEVLPPDDFNIAVRFKTGGRPIVKDDCMLALIRCVADLAYSPWESVLLPVICRSRPHANIAVRPSTTAFMGVKHAVWSLQQLLSWWIHNQGGHFAETNFIARSNRSILGFGSVQSSDVQLGGDGTAESDAGLSNSSDITFSDASNITDIAVAANGSGDVGLSRLRANPIRLHVEQFDPQRSLLSSSNFYLLVVDALVAMAEADPDEPYEGQVMYDEYLNVTLEWGATSPAAYRQGTFTAEMAIEALDEIAQITNHLPARSRFAAFAATIRRMDDGAVVGRMNFHKGEKPEWLESDVTTQSAISAGDGGVQAYRRRKRARFDFG